MAIRSVIIVHPSFDADWPFAADHFHELWKKQGAVEFIRLKEGDTRPGSQCVANPGEVTRLAVFRALFTPMCATAFSRVREGVFDYSPETSEEMRKEITACLTQHGVKIYKQTSEGFWGQSVAEFALGLTICGLRRIPQTHHEMITDLSPWDYAPAGGKGLPGTRGYQFGDDTRFANGTIAGKRVRIVGAGNIASRFASYCHMLGADVAAWDPFASEPCFHRAGARRVHRLDELLKDAEIFAPMLPLTKQTEGLVTSRHIDLLPKGTLVVEVTRSAICDEVAIRRRVLADEIALAADVFDREPLPLDDPLLGRHNVVHTPHNAGRTVWSNRQWAESLAAQFEPVG